MTLYVPVPDTNYRVEMTAGGTFEDGRVSEVLWKIGQQVSRNDRLEWDESIHGMLKYTGCCQMWPSVKEADGPMLHFDTLGELLDTLPACFKELWNHCFHVEGALMKWAEFL